MDNARWRDSSSRRGALLRVALFTVMYVGLEYLLGIVLFGLVGKWKAGAELVSAIATLGAALLAGGMMITSLDQRRIGALGFAWTSQSPREILQGLMVGCGGNAVAALMLVAIGALTYVNEQGTAMSWLVKVAADFVVFAFAAAAEEAVFRGYGFQALVRGFGALPAAIGAAALFAIAHAGNPNVTHFGLLNIFLAGVLLGLAYLRTMSLWFATAVHAGWNWMMASLLDLPVSGISSFRTPLYEPVERGARWVTGGTFGPEGGVAGTIGLVVMLLAILFCIRLRVAPEMSALRPIALRETTSMGALDE